MPGFRSLATLKLVVNVVGEFQPKRTAAASRGFLATARLSCFIALFHVLVLLKQKKLEIWGRAQRKAARRVR